MTFALAFPTIDPVLVEIGPVSIRWYALAYIVGLLLGWLYIRHLAKRFNHAITPRQVDDLLVWVTLGVILGGRLGHVLFYKPDFYFAHPAEILSIWQGGMSFHGGLVGVAAALLFYAWRHRISWLALADHTAPAVPIGLFLGRLANFANGELYGRATELPWGMVFPAGGPGARHPSQIYEALLEGLLLFVLLYGLGHWSAAHRHPGLLTGVFLAGYALARIAVEFVREPDAYLGFLLLGSTMGQLLSLPMLALGLYLIASAQRRPGGAT